MVTCEPGSASASLVEGLGFRLSRLARALRSTWSRELVDLGLTPPLAAVLRAVSEEPGISVRALARTLGSDAMSAKRCADELEALGFIRSGSLEGDRRPRTLTITPRGRVLAKRINELVALREGLFETVLGASGRETLFQLVGELESSLQIGEGVFVESTQTLGGQSPERGAVRAKSTTKRKLR